MYCTKCGNQNPDGAWSCASCGEALQRPPAPTTSNTPPPAVIPNYLVQSILVTLFCCWPFGIPAIVLAAKVNGLAASGNIAGALDASNKAKMWCWISFGLGLVTLIGYAGLMLIGIIADS